MRHRAPRSLHVLLCAPVAALLGVAATSSSHAQAASTPSASSATASARADAPPTRYVVAIDAGHGGSPDNAHPEKSYDAGAVGANGLLEKDVTLDMARRVRTLLERDDVAVVMTRDSDVNIDITPRMDTAIAAGAGLFVSIHMNGYADPSASGSLVMYPNEQSRAFAQVMADGIAQGLSPYGVQPRGLQLRPEMWQHASMPACTLEPVFITNPVEADLMTRDDVRDALAHAIVDGIETQAPQIAASKAGIEAWKAAHPGAALPSPPVQHVAIAGRVITVPLGHTASRSPAVAASTVSGRSRLAAAILALVLLPPLLVLFRRRLARLVVRCGRGMIWLVARLEGVDPPPRRGTAGRAAARGGQRQERRQLLIERGRRRGLVEDLLEPRRDGRGAGSARFPRPAIPRR